MATTSAKRLRIRIPAPIRTSFYKEFRENAPEEESGENSLVRLELIEASPHSSDDLLRAQAVKIIRDLPPEGLERVVGYLEGITDACVPRRLSHGHSPTEVIIVDFARDGIPVRSPISLRTNMSPDAGAGKTGGNRTTGFK